MVGALKAVILQRQRKSDEGLNSKGLNRKTKGRCLGLGLLFTVMPP